MKLQDYWDLSRQEAVRLKLKYHITQPCEISIGVGWIPVVEAALDKIYALGRPVHLRCVKQKFCQLRIYVNVVDVGFDAIIESAKHACDNFCEACGKEREYKGFRLGLAICEACNLLL